MTMKYPMLSFLLAAALTTNAQIQVGSNEMATLNRPGVIGKDDLAALKKSTVLFTLPYSQYNQQAAYEASIKSVWTLTPFKIIKPDEMGKYTDQGGYAIFSFGGFVNAATHNGVGRGAGAWMHLAYDLWMPKTKKSGKVNQQFFGRILIYPDMESYGVAMQNLYASKSDFSQRLLSYIYNDAIIYNFSPGLLKGYLKEVNDRLHIGDERGPFSEMEDKAALKSLQHDTLYVPDYVNLKVNMFTGAQTETVDDDDLRKAYKFPIRILPKPELDKLIADT
ncbi:MAG: hypothetical protein QM642_11650 [Edaphocola sp.]